MEDCMCVCVCVWNPLVGPRVLYDVCDTCVYAPRRHKEREVCVCTTEKRQ